MDIKLDQPLRTLETQEVSPEHSCTEFGSIENVSATIGEATEKS